MGARVGETGSGEIDERAHDRLDASSLLAKEAIREALYAELDAWRRRDWTRMRAGFAPEARIDLADVDAELARLAEAMGGVVASSLLASNCRIELGLGGRAARSTALILAAHEPPPETGERTCLAALRFSDQWIRDQAGEWKVARRATETLWRAWLEPRRDDRAGDHRHATEWER